MFLHKPYIWESALHLENQSHYMIFKSSISLEQTDEIAPFFAFKYKFSKIKSCSKIFWLGMIKIWIWPIWSLDFKISRVNRCN